MVSLSQSLFVNCQIKGLSPNVLGGLSLGFWDGSLKDRFLTVLEATLAFLTVNKNYSEFKVVKLKVELSIHV